LTRIPFQEGWGLLDRDSCQESATTSTASGWSSGPAPAANPPPPVFFYASLYGQWMYKSTPTCCHAKSALKGHWPCKLFTKGPSPSPIFPPTTFYCTHNDVIHSKDTISKPPFPTSPTKYKKCKLFDSSIVA
jgi:hypothetical protein